MKKRFIFALVALILAAALAVPVAAGDAMAPSVVTTAKNDPTVEPGVTTGLTQTTTSLPSSGEPEKELSSALSPALDIIAANSPMAKAGIAGREIAFSKNDFARVMNLSKINTLEIVSVPASSEGVLLLGNTVIAAGQTLTASSIDLLSFDPATDAPCLSSFEFSVNGCEYSISCSLYMLASPNANPTVATVAEASLNLGGYADTALFGKLEAHDPEGDALTFQIIDRPDRGLLILTDKNEGRYTYLPENGFSGSDGFTYVVCDKYGNYSSSAKVSLKISDPKTSVVYADMLGNEAACAAIEMTEKGIMSGVQVGSIYNFRPDDELSRVDFLVIAMKAAGINKLPEANSTGFYDDASISASAKPYVAAAKQLGYISGSTDKSGNLCFFPDEKISRAEAALVIDEIIDAKSHLKPAYSATPVFLDSSEIPSWAESSLSDLTKLGIMTDDYGRINATKNLTRGEAAIILSRVIQVTDK